VSALATPEEGMAQALRLRDLFRAAGTSVKVQLLAPPGRPFDGRLLLDVLVSLGMPPGPDGHCPFAGFEAFTRTPPGKLEARALLEGSMRPTSLTFELYVPHAPRAAQALELMLQASRYAEKRLGGTRELQMETFGAARKSDDKGARAQAA